VWVGYSETEELAEDEACEVCFERAADTRLLPCRPDPTVSLP
jgi:hypothetical protein